MGIVQGMLTDYRAPLFDDIALRCTRGLSVLAGTARKGQAIKTVDLLEHAKLVHVRNFNLFSGTLNLVWQKDLLSNLRDIEPDVLIVQASPRMLTTKLAIRFMKARRRPVLGWGLGTMEVVKGLSGLRSFGRTRFLKKLDGIIAYSSRAAEEYAMVGIPQDRIWVAANAIARRPDHSPPARPDNFDEPAVILFVGRLIEWKRLDLLIEACAKVSEKQQIKLRIVGDGPARAGLEQLANQIYPSTVFTGGLFGEKLTPEFYAADLFVLPGMGGLAIQQAMAHGLPVIVAEGDGTQTDLIRPESGWNVTPDSSDALAKLIEEAISDRARLREMGKHAYKIVAEEINIENMVEVFIRVLRQITGQQ